MSSIYHESSTRAVNNLLHTLRGEQFRHSQNVQRSRAHVSTSLHSHNSPTLPVNLANTDYAGMYHEPAKPISNCSTYSSCSGPRPPRSWALTPKNIKDIRDTSSWRANALSIILSPPPESKHVPSLTILCLRILASYPDQKFAQDVVPHLPPHLRRELIRDTAVQSPLSSPKLYALYESDGHADNELLIIGPNGTLNNLFIRDTSNRRILTRDAEVLVGEENDSWDSERPTSEPLTVLILISTSLASSSLLSLPPTITKMALINLSTLIPIHRLPSICPLLVILDLSYNTWLAQEDNANRALERVQWSRWNHLRVVGLRECHISDVVRENLNRGRWDEVEIVQ